MNLKKILIFGVFDGIHDGHLSYISEAKMHGDQLIAVVARDSIVEKIKGNLPKYNEIERIKNLLEVPDIDLVLLGDPSMGSYNVLREVNPSIIYLGYDQNALKDDLNIKIKEGLIGNMDILQGKAYKPEIFHSSFLNKN